MALTQPKKQVYLIIVVMAFLSGSYLILAGSTVGLATVQYDEFTDLVIASQLSSNPLSGSVYDGSQARLPMYVTATAYQVMQFINPDLKLLDILITSRWISILMTVLAIWGTFLLGYQLFDTTIGLLAGTLFAFSPYTLQFGRDALTQGDAFAATTVVLAIIAFVQFDRQRTTRWLIVLSFCLALAIGSKFLLVVIIPALICFQWITETSQRYQQTDQGWVVTRSDKKAAISSSFVWLAIITGVLALLALGLSLNRANQILDSRQLLYRLAQLFWLIDLGLIVLILLSTFQPFGARWSHLLQPNFRWHWKGAWLAILPLTLAISLAIFPSHIFNPYIIPTLLGRLITMDGSADFLATMLASAKLYFGLILVKLGLPFGILTYAALALLVKKSIYQKRFLLITLILLFYGCLLAILPLQQPFWLMSVYSLILLSLSAMIVFGFRHRSNRTWTLAWSGLIGLAVVWLGFGLFQVYPVYGYYGYETIGDQWLGTNSKGYRAVVVVTNDGSVEAIDWLRQNASPGSRVLSYLDDTHIINYLEENQKLNFELKQAPKLAENVQQLDQVLKQADFVVFNVINNVDLAPPTSAPAFIQQFGTKPIYQIFRGRGIYRLSIIQIYQRIASTERSI